MNTTTKKRGGLMNANLLPSGAQSKGESAHNAGPTPTEYGNRWQPLLDKLSIREAQYLNTYTRTGDIAAINALVLGIIAERAETAAERDRLREQVLELLVACKVLVDHAQETYPHFESERGQRDIAQAQAAILNVEGKQE